MTSFESLNIVPAEKAHEKFLYELRNDPATRKWMFDDQPVDYPTHQKWFSRSLKSDTRSMFLLEKEKVPVGQIRFDRSENGAHIDFSVAPEERGNGYGWYLLVMACFEFIHTKEDIDHLYAKVKPENLKSCRAFLTAGFQQHSQNELWIEFRLYKNLKPVVVATVKSWNIRRFFKIKAHQASHNWVLVTHKNQLIRTLLERIEPEWVLLPHWSWIIPESVYSRFNCIVFHMTDLPFGRGGSPMQNLIARGIYQTKISAIQVVEELDAGDIYCQEDFDLSVGNADELFNRASAVIYNKMIPFIFNHAPVPQKQKGDIVCFDRRRPDQGDISRLDNIDQIYDFIRMLDGEGYPNAFVQFSGIKIEFFNAQKDGDQITAGCRIVPE
jgi:methionyl-tRNA formyltransferase